MTDISKSDGRITVPNKLDSAAAIKLKIALDARIGEPISLDARAVTLIGAQSVQVLLAAKAKWSTHGQQFDILNLSNEIIQILGMLGVSPHLIGFQEVPSGS